MFKVENIKENNDFIIFFKIIEKKFIKNFQQDGQVYFGLLKDYRKMEEDGHQEVGDSYEASLTQKIQLYIKVSDSEYEEIHGYKSGNNIRINANQCAFCFYALGLKCFDKKSETKFIHKIPIHLIEELCKDKGGVENCAIMIFDDEFIDKVKDELKKKQLSFMSKKVSYDDYDYIPQFDIHSKEYALECCFHKESKYEYQKEFRKAAINHSKHPIDNLYINVTENDFTIMDIKENSDFCCYVKIDAEKIEAYSEKERQKVQFSFSFSFENN